jgi:glycosyltransferase involved in cell wall biosynthesis
VCYDGRAAAAAELEEYAPMHALTAQMPRVERRAVRDCDYRVAVSHQLVAYWGSRFDYASDRHAVIPLPVYAGYQSGVGGTAARRLLRIPSHASVILVFGSVRNAQERELVQSAVLQARIPAKVLVAPSFGTPVRPSRRHPLAWLRWEAGHHELLWPRRLRVGSARVRDDRVHLYFSAADVVLLPRMDTLNSGVLPLAFQYGRVVVGPDCGNMGPVLRATRNPVFDPSSPHSCAAALEEGVRRCAEGAGAANAAYAAERWSLRRIAQMHVEFYTDLMTNA